MSIVRSTSDLSGIFAPVPTPFHAGDWAFDAGRFTENLHRWLEGPLDGLLVLGSNGEAPLLSDAEADAVVRAARAATPAGKVLLAGAGRQSTAATVEAARRAFDAGADAALVVTPSYYRGAMTAEALRRHYEIVAEQSGGPVLLYHVPVFTGVDLPVETVLQLASHPAVVGIKDSSGDVGRMERLTASPVAGFAVLTGHAPTLFPALALGAAGGILAAACVVPSLCGEIRDAVRRGDPARARELQALLEPVARAVTSGHGIPGLKALLDHLGWYGGPVRPPLADLPPAARAELLEIWSRYLSLVETS